VHSHVARPVPQVSKFGALLRLRRHFRNWFSVLVLFYLHRSPRAVFLRDGTVLRFGADGRMDPGILVQLIPRLLEAGWTIAPLDATHALLSNARTGTRLKCRFLPGWSDVIPLLEVYEDRVYGEDFADKVVLDIGMANGDSSIFFAQHGARLVLGLEPIPESVELARENVRLNGLEGRVVPLHAALNATLGKISIRVSSRAPNRSSVAPDDARTATAWDTSVEVETLSIPELIQRYHLERIDYVKMDCEGCEYSVVRGLPPEAFGVVRRWEMEFHNGPQDLPTLLERHGFRVVVEGGTLGYLRADRTAV
jgi:FkbM family methyltransferase